MAPKFQIVLAQDTFYRSAFEEGYSSSILKGKLIFAPSSPMKVNGINLCFRGKLFLNTGIQPTHRSIFQYRWAFYQNSRSTSFEAKEHVYEFELPLPAELPESVDADYARIQYSLRATVETPLFASNLRTDKVVNIRQHVDTFMSVRYNTHIESTWKDMVDYEVILPSHEYSPGDTIPITFKHHIRDNSYKLVSIWAGLGENTVYTSVIGSSTETNTVQKWLRTDYIKICSDTSYMTLIVPKSVRNIHYDGATQYVQVSHTISIRIDVELNGEIKQIRVIMPIRIVRDTLSTGEVTQYDPLPIYEKVRFDCPPAYLSYISNCNESPPQYLPSFSRMNIGV
ncbi:hypothetical protein K7432_011639 [Basidiobolus ranarum]|uniref:Arrestin C-terminal-like domain-containing protein n=1 Tax=Basidiobolus ranarum TaxID=34480 RepID=A0ABR2VTI2_9FUNG